MQVSRLERSVEGANIPLPAGLIRSLLNMLVPSVSLELACAQLTRCSENIVCSLNDATAMGGGERLSSASRCYE